MLCVIHKNKKIKRSWDIFTQYVLVINYET